jgi:hypothetical protein
VKAKNLATVAFSVIFLVSLAVNGYLFFSVNTEQQSQVERFQNQVNDLEKQIVNLDYNILARFDGKSCNNAVQ